MFGLSCPFCRLPLWGAPGCPGLWFFCLGCRGLFLPQRVGRFLVAELVFSPEEVAP